MHYSLARRFRMYWERGELFLNFCWFCHLKGRLWPFGCMLGIMILIKLAVYKAEKYKMDFIQTSSIKELKIISLLKMLFSKLFAIFKAFIHLFFGWSSNNFIWWSIKFCWKAAIRCSFLRNWGLLKELPASWCSELLFSFWLFFSQIAGSQLSVEKNHRAALKKSQNWLKMPERFP